MNFSCTFVAAVILVVCSSCYGSPAGPTTTTTNVQKPIEAAQVGVKEVEASPDLPSIVQEDISSFGPNIDESQPAPLPSVLNPEDDIEEDEILPIQENAAESKPKIGILFIPIPSYIIFHICLCVDSGARTKRHYTGGYG